MEAINEGQMSPDTSPGEQSGRSGVRRVNNLPVYIVVGGLAVFLLIMVLVASDRAARQRQQGLPAETAKTGTTSMFAKDLAGDQKDGLVQPKESTPPALLDPAPSGAVAIARPTNLDQPPLPRGTTQSSPSQSPNQNPPVRSAREEEAIRLRLVKMQQFDEAVKARTSLPVAMPRSAASSPVPASLSLGGATNREEMLTRLAAVRQQIEVSTRDDSTAAFQARLQQVQAAGLGGVNIAAGTSEVATVQPPAGRNDIAQFSGAGQGDRWRLDSRPEPPRTPYQLRAGFIVPAVLISGINSELPGQIMAQVSQDVYDTPIGKYRLIPQGSRLVGVYANDIAYGQSRILVAWQRIVFPDGKAMDIGAMPGADSAGYAGFRDQVNNHYFRLFASAFLMSGVTAGIALSQPETTSVYGRQSASGALSEALGQQLGQVTAQMIAKNLNIAPTLEIRPGYRFNVIVVKDMTFSKPYKAFDY